MDNKKFKALAGFSITVPDNTLQQALGLSATFTAFHPPYGG